MNATLLRFQLFGLPIQVTWTALILLFILGAQAAGGGADGQSLLRALIFGILVFASILVHELGHALVGRRLGLRPQEIVVHGFGGLCRYGRAPTPKEGVFSSLAGPFAGLALGGLALGLSLVVPDSAPPGVHFALDNLIWINIFWSLFNLLPIFPMDGGHVLVSSLQLAMKPLLAWKITRVVSVGLAILVGIVGFQMGMRFVPVIMVFILLQNVRF